KKRGHVVSGQEGPRRAGETMRGEAEGNVLSDAEIDDLFGEAGVYDVLDEADYDLIAVAGTELGFEGWYAHDPDNEPPLHTFQGMCTQGGKELDLLAACERQIAFLHGVETRALARFARLRPDRHGNPVSKYTADEIGVAARWTTRYASSRLELA